MSNVPCVAWRNACLGLRSSGLHPLNLAAPFRSLGRPISATWCLDSTPRRLLSSSRQLTSLFALSPIPNTKCPSPNRVRSRRIQSSAALSAKQQGKARPSVEKGVELRNNPFTKVEIDKIFGARAKLSPAIGNWILSVLQGRRVDGTLDLDLPADITRAASPAALDAGLDYLRKTYELDEEAAIMARIEREELEAEQKLTRRAEKLGLYKPQSGSYGAELGKKNDPSGKSVMEQIRERNRKKNAEEEEKQRQEWLEGEAKEREQMKRNMSQNKELHQYALTKSNDKSALDVRTRADPREQPLLAWVQKHHLRATDTETDYSKIKTSTRLIPAALFTIIALGLCYAFAVTYQPPARKDRMWPNIPPAIATLAAIIGINTGVYLLWFFPPAWKQLNRYFISVAVSPRVFSLLGNVFSHQKISHLGMNTLVLCIFAPQLHDDIGRGNFLALYLASGLVGSFVSLTIHVLRNMLVVTSLGASGANAGIMAASGLYRENDKWTVWFVPEEWAKYLSAPAAWWLAVIVGSEIVGAIVNRRRPKIDYFAHFGGYLTGGVFAYSWRARVRRKREKNRSWLDKIVSKS